MNSKAIVFNLTPPVDSNMDVVFSDILGIFSKPELSESDIVHLSNFVKVDVPYLGDNIINRAIGSMKRVSLLAAIKDNNEIQFCCKHNDCRLTILWRAGFGIVKSNTEIGQNFDVGDIVALKVAGEWTVAGCRVASSTLGGPIFYSYQFAIETEYTDFQGRPNPTISSDEFSEAILLEKKTK